MTAQNPTPYYITIISLSRVRVKKSLSFRDYDCAEVQHGFSVTDGGVRDFAMMYVNDYGGHRAEISL